MTTKEAVEHLTKALESDPGYWICWQANIAMAFKDEFNRHPLNGMQLKDDIHEIANTAADNFLKRLCYRSEAKDTSKVLTDET